MSNLLIKENPLLVLPSLAKKIGLNEAIVLQQVHFWVSKESNYEDGRYWVYNTYKDWSKQFPFWSESTIKRTFRNLIDMDLIISKNFNRMKIDQTRWYTVNYEALRRINDHTP